MWLVHVGLGAMVVLGICCASEGSVTIKNPIGAATGSASGIYTDQFLGARFQFTAPVEVESVGGVFQNALGGTYFAALVPLASMNALPTGDPANGVPFNPGEVLAYQTFGVGFPGLMVVPFSITLDPGVYGVVFGTGLYGTSGAGMAGMPRYQEVPGSNSFFWSSSPYRWQTTTGPYEHDIQITFTPEPATLSLLALGGLALRRRRKKVRDGAGAASVLR